MLTVILTGGASRRMGRDKAMLAVGEKTMLQHLVDKYSSIGPAAVSVNEKGRFPFSGAAELCDAFPNEGPLNGLVSAFSETDEETVFLTGTDLPFGDPSLALRLAELLDGHEACVIRRDEDDTEPLFAVYSRACYEPALACLRGGRRSFRALFELIDVRYVADAELRGFDLDRILMNVNDPAEYEKAVAYLEDEGNDA